MGQQMARKRFDVEIPEGQHLGFSRDTDGAYRAHLFDDQTNDLVGHAELFEGDTDETRTPRVEYIYVSDSEPSRGHDLSDEELEETIEALLNLALIVTMLAIKAAPHIAGWWRGTAVPTLKLASGTARSAVRSVNEKTVRSIRSKSDTALLTLKSALPKLHKDQKAENDVLTGETVAAGPENPRRPAQLETAFTEYRSRMGSTEARERFVAALVARAFSDQQMQALRDATLEDNSEFPGLNDAMKALTPQRVGETMSVVLEKNPSLLEPHSISELRAIFSGGNEGLALRIERPRTAETW